MAKTRFWSLSPAERTEAVSLATRRLRRADYLLEKDIWVVTVLDILFSAPFGGDLIFKGGTSLSKAWGAVRRFSEDVDITYDIRVVAKDLVAGAGREALPPSRSQEAKWTKAIRARLPSGFVTRPHPPWPQESSASRQRPGSASRTIGCTWTTHRSSKRTGSWSRR